MKIAIVGTGIAGMAAAWMLHREHEITVFEADSHIGGHTNTIAVHLDGREYAIDTGFIVFNDRTYPNFTRLLARLGVASQPAPMSFSVRCDRSGLEYNGTSFNKLFAQRRNLARPAFLLMIRDLLRFYRQAPAVLSLEATTETLGEYLFTNGYSSQFIDQHIVPMAAAVWSADPLKILDYPIQTFVRFFDNHGMLSLSGRPQWRAIAGGSWRYAEKLTAPYRYRIRLDCPIESVERRGESVTVKPRSEAPERFDRVVMAAHPDQALRMLADASAGERAVLGAFDYQENETILHTDESVLPRCRRAWAAWNYRLLERPGASERVAMTYNMNILQTLDASAQFLVTLNQGAEIDPAKVLRRITYYHPIFNQRSIAAQRRHHEISGANRIHYCGAYWGYGFHEDGVRSAMRVAAELRRARLTPAGAFRMCVASVRDEETEAFSA
ncbi:MAG: NAD(P)/FAD-dependent oxidoreductase [Candidatus Binataceae bacterium]